MTRDPLDDLSKRLFGAGQCERPPDELRACLLSRAQPAAGTEATFGVPEPRMTSPRRRVTARWLLLAAALLGAALAFGRMRIRSPAPPIVADQTRPPSHESRGIPRPVPTEESHTGPPPPAAPTPSPSTPRHAPLKAAPRTSESATIRPQHRATLAEELESLKRVRALLRSGDHEGALRALDAYSNELGGSSLSAEATMLRIEALAAAGRRDEAANLAHGLVAHNPDSPLVDRARGYLKTPREISSAP